MTYLYIKPKKGLYISSVDHEKKKDIYRIHPRDRSTKEDDEEYEDEDFGGNPCLC